MPAVLGSWIGGARCAAACLDENGVDRWAATQASDTLEDRYTPFDIRQIKSGVFAGWRTKLERQAAELGESWKPIKR